MSDNHHHFVTSWLLRRFSLSKQKEMGKTNQTNTLRIVGRDNIDDTLSCLKFSIKFKSYEDKCVHNLKWLFVRRVLESMIIIHVVFMASLAMYNNILRQKV